MRCVVARQYGTPKKPFTLAFKAPPTEKTLQLVLLRTAYRKGTIQTGATLKVDQEPFGASALTYPLAGKDKRMAHLINLDLDQATAVRTAKDLKVTVREGIDEEFPLGEMSAVWKDLDECTERLVDTWNVGAERETRVAEGPKGDLGSVISADDYPPTAHREDQQGTANFIILIDEKGMPRDCTLIGTSGSAVLDSRSCGVIMQRARFSPALNPSGKPVKSSWKQAITWRLEG